MEKKGIKELLDILTAVQSISIDIIDGLKDGLGYEDIAILTDNLDLIKEAVDGASEVGSELADLDVLEIKELINFLFDMVIKIIASVKAPKK